MKSKTNKTLPGSRKAKLPSFVSPQLATTLVKEPPSGDDWLHELKFDGYRMLLSHVMPEFRLSEKARR